MCKLNENAVDEKVIVNRNQIEHRATWMALMFDEMRKAGVDAEGITRRAIRRTGNIHGQRLLNGRESLTDCSAFQKEFLGEEDTLVPQTFLMKLRADEDNCYADFHYCALLQAWKKLGFDDETCALLCDMAMDGDRGIAEAIGIELDLGDTLAKGCENCKLHFHKK